MRALLSLAVLVVSLAGCDRSAGRVARRDSSVGEARVTVERPTVLSYFVIPPGAVDTMPDLAVEADDWNVAMAALRDSLEASGIDLAMVTDSSVRVRMRGRRDTTLTLGRFKSSGYILFRPDGRRCAHPGGADADSIRALARAFARDARCT